jgi:hypothetical protein
MVISWLRCSATGRGCKVGGGGRKMGIGWIDERKNVFRYKLFLRKVKRIRRVEK